MIYGDSNLVVQQTMKECDAATDNMIAYRNLYNIMEGNFDGCELRHVDRVMHVKCIHELCTITLVFHSYLHHKIGRAHV